MRKRLVTNTIAAMPYDKQQLNDFKRFRDEIIKKDEIELRLLPQPTFQSIGIYSDYTANTITFESAETNFTFNPLVSVQSKKEKAGQHFITYYADCGIPTIELHLRSNDFLGVKSLFERFESRSINLSVEIRIKRITPYRMYFNGDLRFFAHY